MKKFLSLVLALVMTMSLVTISAGAKDFTDKSSITYGEAVSVISAIGVVDGYTDGSFNPSATLTRGAAAKIICNLMLGSTTAGALTASSAPYSDVPTSNVFAGYIAYCAQQGIISGYADGTFRPAATLTSFAFMKMLLGALGYDGEVEGYAVPNWQINVAKQALNIGLDDGLEGEFNGNKPVTREEAALYAFNMLQADMVEYEAKTTVNVGGASVTVGGSAAKAVKWNNSADADGNIEKDGYIQFAEQYFNKLDKTETTDDFARPATKWTYKGDKIGTYADKADVSYVGNQKLGTIYADLGMTQKDASAKVFYNGKAATDVAVTKGNTVKISTKGGVNAGLAGDGTAVEVFYDDDNNDVRICLIDTYVGEIASKEANVADPYVVVSPYSDVKNTDNTTSIIIGGKNARFETDVDNFEDGDVILFTYSISANEIKSVAVAEKVEGSLTKFVMDDSLTIGDTTYAYNKTIAFSMGQTSMQTKGNYTVYLDTNGKAIYVDEQEFDASQYAFVLAVQSAEQTGFTQDRAKLVLSDGTLKTVYTDDDYTDLLNTIVYYRADSNNEYALRQAANVVSNGSITTTADNNIHSAGVISNGSASFDMKNTQAAINVDGTHIYYGNSETVFVIARSSGTALAPKTDYQVYTGIKNAPTINGGVIEAIFTTSGNSKVMTFCFIDATGATTYTNGKKDIVFLAGESVTDMVTDSDNNQYYLYNAVVDGEITTVKVRVNQESGSHLNLSTVANRESNWVITNADYTNKNLLKYADPATSAGYARLDDGTYGAGVWKLSGSYSIGLGTSKMRETVASDAKMFVIDTDGNITKIDDVKNITSDSTAKFIALRDNTDGDIAYLFVQQVENGKTDNAVVDSNVKKVTLATSGVVTVDLTAAPSASKTYTVTLEKYIESSDKWISAGTDSVNFTTSETQKTVTFSIPVSNGGIYRASVAGVVSNSIVK